MFMFMFVSLSFTTFINSVFSSTAENITVLQQAQKSLDANQKQLGVVTPEPVPNVVPATVQEIKGTSIVEGVFFTWVIISSDNEISINLRYVGDGTTPPISVAATALSGQGKPVTMEGSTSLNAGWSSPSTVDIELKGGSSLYDSNSLNVVALPLGSSPPLPSTATATVKPQTSLLIAVPAPRRSDRCGDLQPDKEDSDKVRNYSM
jgi:hypothetical protein